MSIIVYTVKKTPRTQYAWEVLLNYLLKVDFTWVDDEVSFIHAIGAKINYSDKRLCEEEVFVPKGALLDEDDIAEQALVFFDWLGLPAFFAQTSGNPDIPFDLPAAAFYLISRYEEYLPCSKDQHGRFTAHESLAYKKGFLQQPLVNQWACALKDLMKRRFPQLVFPVAAYHFQPTYDVDLAWAYRYKGWQRSIGALLRSLLSANWKDAWRRIGVAMGKMEDPFFTFAYLDTLHQHYGLQPIYFFLLGDYSTFDKNISYEKPALRRLIRQLQERYPIGIHPSYRSHGNPLQTKKEVNRLKEITNQHVVKSRQHYLLLQLPFTYRYLLEAGILADYTMGYAREIGFRASISTPYPWYDLQNERITPLMIYPFAVMDVTLKNYMRLSPEAAITKVAAIIETVRRVNGTFSTVWHNSSFSQLGNWQAWKPVYEKIIQAAITE